MSLLSEARSLLHRYGVKPRKRLGQSFAIDRRFLEKMAKYAELNRSDVVLDVGAGLGFLTEILAEKAGEVIAIEVDANLVRALRNRLNVFKNVKIIKGDFLKMETPYFTKVVSNPPYAISSPLVFKLLSEKFDYGICTFQEDFARRLTAKIGESDYGRLTVMTYYYADIKLLEYISPKSFYPIPEVGSAVVRLTPRRPPFKVVNEEFFSDLVRMLFTQRRREVKKALKVFFNAKKVPRRNASELIEKLPFIKRRVGTLAPEDFGVLSNEIYIGVHAK